MVKNVQYFFVDLVIFTDHRVRSIVQYVIVAKNPDAAQQIEEQMSTVQQSGELSTSINEAFLSAAVAELGNIGNATTAINNSTFLPRNGSSEAGNSSSRETGGNATSYPPPMSPTQTRPQN